MKNKLLILFLIFANCTNPEFSNPIVISPEIVQNITELENNSKLEIDLNETTIINYWASWCLECIQEHQLLIQLSEIESIKNSIYAISFQDSKPDAINFLEVYGKGNIKYGIDKKSALAINSGVFGVPETHIIKEGKIIKKFIGPLTFNDVEEILIIFSK